MDLKDIKAAVERKYVSLPITFTESDDLEAPKLTLSLRNILRLSEDEQKQVDLLGERMKETTAIATTRAAFQEYLTLLSGDGVMVRRFLAVIDNDLAIILTVVEEYQKVTQAEKAASS